MTVFFTGCTHFGHVNIIALAKRPFASVEEMDAILIENWNKTVKPQDTVIHHGDFKWPKSEVTLRDLNGKIRLIKGNHDVIGFGPDYAEETFSGRKFVLMHYPLEEWNGWWGGALHTHCHTHSPDLVSAPRRFNVGVDATGFAPISIDEIMAHDNARFTHA